MRPIKTTITAKIQIYPSHEQKHLLKKTLSTIKIALNDISCHILSKETLHYRTINNEIYYHIREKHGLKSQMTQSCIKTTLSRYKTNKSNGHDKNLVVFKNPDYDLVYNRDYSLSKDGLFSINTLDGRLKIPFETQGMAKYFDDTYDFGTAKLIFKFGKFFLHIPMTKEYPEFESNGKYVGIDLGINFVATTYDSDGKTMFFSGRKIKHIRGQYKDTRKALQERDTKSANRRLKIMGSRENRYVTDMNHVITKALFEHYGTGTTFFIEDLTGIRSRTERVRVEDRYVSVSWAFHQFRMFLEYKAKLYGCKVVLVDPRYTSQTCPVCGHVERGNRNKPKHRFECKKCHYCSNDDRIGAMNILGKGFSSLQVA